MSTQHTPGPWKVERLSGKKGEKYVWMDGEYWGGHAIATVHDRIPERAEDNARLLAAAPELLDALTVLLDHAQEKYPHFESERGQADIARALAAIAKAKGE